MDGSTEWNIGLARLLGRVGFAMPGRSSRLVTPSEKGSQTGDEADRPEESQSATDAVRATNKRVGRASSTRSEPESTGVIRSKTADEESERALLLKVLEELQDLKNESIKQQRLIYKLKQEAVNTKEELEKVRQQLQSLQASVSSAQNSQTQSPRASYADTVRTPPLS